MGAAAAVSYGPPALSPRAADHNGHSPSSGRNQTRNLLPVRTLEKPGGNCCTRVSRDGRRTCTSGRRRRSTTLKRTMRGVLRVVVGGPVLLFSALVLVGLAVGVALTASEL